ncbi:co-chaperone DjlA [Sedimenticola thiotaurini]|uniref:Co-chaperone protein DjlA n=1 Tax=Sedimenticola thiotaurini TaxID=1543721 RepID=A0A0F7K1Z5_9GAMM|nr:co-chaperone DjlA [Sedimenticola thiotaurini]AKH20963.1 molecular chaperone DnaJ [Sedimenticola thiotaurini]
MSWWGKLAGGAFGFMVGGPIGALLGAVLGHNLDKGLKGLSDEERLPPGDQERVQTAFFTTTFSVMGAIAKADGRVSRDEIALANSVMAEMDLNEEMRRTAINLFNQGKSADFPLDEVLNQFRRECHRRNTLIQMFIEIQLQAAYADGSLHKAEEQLLLHICKQLGIPEFAFRRLEKMIRAEAGFSGRGGGGRQAGAKPSGPTLEDAYAILNVSSDASNAEVKQAYRRLLSQHHPDKLVSKGLPEEMMKMAAQKTHEIRQAYERVKEARGI